MITIENTYKLAKGQMKSECIYEIIDVLSPKGFTHGGITLAKGQLGHSYIF
jgi:hypothetical protein